MNAWGATLAGLLGVALAPQMAGPAPAMAREVRVQVGPNVPVNPPAFIDANNSPTIARNPRHSDNLVVAHRIDRPRYSAGLSWTADGGANWHRTALPLPPDKDRPYAPDVAFGPDGSLYVLYVNLQGRGNDPDNLWLAKSTDGGRTLGPPTRVGGRYTFQSRLAVDSSGVIHAIWVQADELGTLSVNGPTRVVASRSTDDGTTFSPPVAVSDGERVRVGAVSPAIGAGGELLVLYQDFKDDRRDFENLEGPAWDRPFALVLSRSRDGGQTFAPGVELESAIVPLRRFLVYLPELPSIAVGPAGDVVVVWADGRYGDEDVLLRRSADGGRTWQSPVRVNDNPKGDGTSQYLPAVDVSDGGRIDVVFLDRRRDQTDVMTDAYLATSLDGGRTFTNARLSSASFDSTVGPVTAAHLGVDLGASSAISSADASAVAVWTDTRLGTEDTGRQDIAATVVSFAEGDAKADWSIYGGSAVGVGVVALAAGIFMGRRRRRHARTGSPPAGSNEVQGGD